jgi:hypothetical protein
VSFGLQIGGEAAEVVLIRLDRTPFSGGAGKIFKTSGKLSP